MRSKRLDFKVIRYTNDEVLNNFAGVLEDLGRRCYPSLQRRGRVKTSFAEEKGEAFGALGFQDGWQPVLLSGCIASPSRIEGVQYVS